MVGRTLTIRRFVFNSEAAVFRSIVQKRKSCFRFQPGRTVESPILKDILESTMRSPSSYNIQPTQIILVQDNQLKKEISEKSMIGKGNQYRTRDCSVLTIFCSDLQPSLRIPRILELERNHSSQPRHPDYLALMPITTSFMLGEGHAATFLKQATMEFLSSSTNRPMPEIDYARVWSYKNTSLMVQTYVLAATSHNLKTSIMEGFDPRHMKELLNIPDDRYGIPMVVATGYEYCDDKDNANISIKENDDNVPQTARLDMNEAVFQETFGIPVKFDPDE